MIRNAIYYNILLADWILLTYLVKIESVIHCLFFIFVVVYIRKNMFHLPGRAFWLAVAVIGIYVEMKVCLFRH